MVWWNWLQRFWSAHGSGQRCPLGNWLRCVYPCLHVGSHSKSSPGSGRATIGHAVGANYFHHLWSDDWKLHSELCQLFGSVPCHWLWCRCDVCLLWCLDAVRSTCRESFKPPSMDLQASGKSFFGNHFYHRLVISLQHGICNSSSSTVWFLHGNLCFDHLAFVDLCLCPHNCHRLHLV